MFQKKLPLKLLIKKGMLYRESIAIAKWINNGLDEYLN